MKTINKMHIFCMLYFFMTATTFPMYYIKSRRKFDYATHRMIQYMGVYALPITGFMVMIENHQKGKSATDSAMSFLIPSAIQVTSSIIRSNFNKKIDIKAYHQFDWYTKKSFNKSMVIISSLFIKQYASDIAENYYKHITQKTDPQNCPAKLLCAQKK